MSGSFGEEEDLNKYYSERFSFINALNEELEKLTKKLQAVFEDFQLNLTSQAIDGKDINQLNHSQNIFLRNFQSISSKIIDSFPSIVKTIILNTESENSIKCKIIKQSEKKLTTIIGDIISVILEIKNIGNENLPSDCYAIIKRISSTNKELKIK